MALISGRVVFSPGGTIYSADQNTNHGTIWNEFNGNISNTNIASAAAIADSKLAQITTSGKVSGAALTTLGSTPTGAGTLPAKNGGTGGDLSAAAQGAVPYFSATGVQSALAVGTAGQVLKTLGAAANPVWVNSLSSVLDYGVSASASTARQGTALKIAYGQFAFSANGSQAITNLTFTSLTSYAVTIGGGYGVSTTENIRAVPDSGSQFTLYNDVNRACTVSWIAVGT